MTDDSEGIDGALLRLVTVASRRFAEEDSFGICMKCGCRLGELKALRWDQVDFSAGQIWLEPKQTKGKTARVVPIYGDLRNELVAAFQSRNENFSRCPFVFHRLGRRIGDFRKAWSTACALADVTITFHDLRRTAVRNLDRAGVPQEVIRRITGHKTDAMFRRYRIVAQSDVADAARKAEEWFSTLDAEADTPGGLVQ